MSDRPVDQTIARLKMDSRDFETSVKRVVGSIDHLNGKMGSINGVKVDGVSKSFDGIQSSVGKIKMDPLINQLDGVVKKMSVFETAITGALFRVGQKITDIFFDVGQRAYKSIVGPVGQGFGEYEKKINSIQTIMSNTKGKYSIDEITGVLDELNDYADKTIYNFGQMVDNIGKFTANGIDMKDATKAIKGMSNLAAGVGADNNQLSRAMYQLSQAMSKGELQSADFRPFTEAGLGGTLFKEEVIKQMKALGHEMESTNLAENFEQALEEGTITVDVLMKALQAFSQDKSLEEAATKVKTFSQLMSTLDESVGSSWSKVFEYIIGNFEEAKEFWTNINNFLTPIVTAVPDAIGDFLKAIKDIGGRTKIIEALGKMFSGWFELFSKIGEGISLLFPPASEKQLMAMVDGFVALIHAITPSPELIKMFGNAIKVVFQILSIGLKILGKTIGLLWDLIKPFIKIASLAINEVFSIIGDSLGWLYEAIKKVTGPGTILGEVFGVIYQVLKAIVDIIGHVIDSFVKIGTAIYRVVGNVVLKGFRTLFGYINNTHEATTIFGKGLKWLSDRIVDWTSKIKDSISWATDGVMSFGKTIVDTIGKWVEKESAQGGILHKTYEGLLRVFNKISSVFSSSIEWIKSARILESISEGLVWLWDRISRYTGIAWAASSQWIEKESQAGGILNNIWNALGDTWRATLDSGSKVFEFLKDFIQNGLTVFEGKSIDLKKIWEDISKFTSGGIKGLGDMVVSAFSPMTVKAHNDANAAKSALNGNAAGDIKNMGKEAEAVGNEVEKTGNIITKIWGAITMQVDEINKMTDQLTSGNVKDLLQLGAGVFISKKVVDVINSRIPVLSDFTKVQEALVGALGKFGTAAINISKGLQKAYTSKMYLNFALAVGIMVGALWLLTKIEFKSTSHIITTLIIFVGIAGALIGGIIAMAKVISVSKKAGIKPNDIKSLAQTYILFAGAVWILASAMSKIAKLNPEQAIPAFFAVIGLIAAMTFAAKFMTSNVSYLGDGKQWDVKNGKVMFPFIQFGAAIYIMSHVIGKLGKMDSAALEKGKSNLYSLMTALAIFQTVTQRVGEFGKFKFDVASTKTNFLSIAGAIAVLAWVLKYLSKIPPSQFEEGYKRLAMVEIVILAFYGVLWVLDNFGKKKINSTGVTANIWTIVKIVATVAGLIKFLGVMPENELVKGGVAVIAIGGFLTALIWATSNIKITGSALNSAKTIQYLGSMVKLIGTLAFIVGLMSLINQGELFSSAAVIGIMVVIVGAMVWLATETSKIKNIQKGTKQLIIMVALVGVLGYIVKMIADVNWVGALVSAVVMIAILSALVIVAAATSKIKINPATIIAVIGLGAVLAVIGLVLSEMTKLPMENILVATLALIGILTVMVIAVGILALLGSSGAGAVGIMGFVSALGALAAVVIGIGVTLTAFAAVLQLMATVGVTAFQNLSTGVGIFMSQLMSSFMIILQELMLYAPQMGYAFATIIITGITGFLTGLAEHGPSMIDNLVAVLLMLGDKFIEHTPALVDKAVKMILAVINGIADSLRNNKEAIKKALWNLITAVWDFLISLVGDVWNWITREGGKWLGDIVDWFIKLPGKIWDAISDFGTKVFNWFGDIGKNILDGIIDGVKNIGKAVMDKVGEGINWVINGAKGLLGIKSPSRVFMQMGEYMSQGMAIGVDNDAGQVVNSVKNLAKSAVDKVKGLGDDLQDAINRKYNLTANVTPVMEDFDYKPISLDGMVPKTNFQSLVPKTPDYSSMGPSNDISNNYDIHIHATGELPDSTIRSMARKIKQEIKNQNDSELMVYGRRGIF